MSTFQACIGQIEKGNVSATEVAITIENLLNNLKLNKQERFVTSDGKKQLEILVGSEEIAEEKFFEVVKSFYDTSLQYADKWICSLGNTDKFKWILLNKMPAWKEIDGSIKHEILTCVQAEETRLFDQWVLIKLIAERQVDKWNEKNLPVSDRWLRIFREMREKHLDFQDFCNVVGFILCLPGSIAPVERIFSVMNSMWTKEKSRLSVETMKAMLIVRQNNDMECDKFYHKVLKNVNMLRKIASSEKYN